MRDPMWRCQLKCKPMDVGVSHFLHMPSVLSSNQMIITVPVVLRIPMDGGMSPYHFWNKPRVVAFQQNHHDVLPHCPGNQPGSHLRPGRTPTMHCLPVFLCMRSFQSAWPSGWLAAFPRIHHFFRGSGRGTRYIHIDHTLWLQVPS